MIKQSRSHGTVAAGSALALTAVLVATGCTPVGGAGGDSADVNILLSSAFDSLDPAKSVETTTRNVQGFLYDTLVTRDPETGEQLPALAESWEFAPTHYSFTINADATCSDGSEVTAETVAANFERAKDPEVNSPLTRSYIGTTEYEVTYDNDARTVDLELAEPAAFPGYGIADGPFIVCGEGLDDPDSLEDKAFGSGPYTLAAYTPGVSLTLAKRDGYAWGTTGEHIQDMPATVEVSLVDDQNTMSNLMLSGTGDIAFLYNDPLLRMREEDGFATQNGYQSIAFLLPNQREGLPGADPALRRALSQALDFEELTKVQTGGSGFVPQSIRAEGTVCTDPGSTGPLIPTGGPEAAAQTLEAGGYEQDSDGRWNKDGAPVVVRFLKADLSTAAAEYVRATWEDAGIQVMLDARPADQVADALFAGTEWDAVIFGLGAEMPSALMPFWTGPLSPDGSNFAAISNERFDAASSAALAVGGEEGCADWLAAENSLVEEVDAVPAFGEQTEWVIRDGVEIGNWTSFLLPYLLRG